VRRYTAQAGLLLLAEDLGDVYPRQLQFIRTADWCACASCAAATTWRRCRANTITWSGWWRGGDADRAHRRLARSNGAASGPAYAVAIDADGG